MKVYEKTTLDEWDHPTINRPDSSNAMVDWTHETDPHGIIPVGWTMPGQYKVVCFPAPSGTDVLFLKVGVKYKGCTGRYSTTRAYIDILRDYLATVDRMEVFKAEDAYLRKAMQKSLQEEPLDPREPRKVRLDRLKSYYLKYLVEDPIDGTSLDCDVLDLIEKLQEKYKNDHGQIGV